MESKIKALVLAGPSASGKSTVAERITEMADKFELVRSVTTREKRSEDDTDYIHTTKERFFGMVESGDMLEYTEYLGNYYGTPMSELYRIAQSGKIPLLILDINGVASLKKNEKIDAYSVYLYADISVLEARLKARYLTVKSVNTAVYDERIARNILEYKTVGAWGGDFDIMVENNAIDKCATNIVFAFENRKLGFDKDVLLSKIQ